MSVTSNLGLLFGSGIALFLVGVNVAFLINLGARVVGWFKFKITAITLLLVYISLSFSYGSPDPWRVTFGMSGLILDVVAICWMWISIENSRAKGIIGLVPLITPAEDD